MPGHIKLGAPGALRDYMILNLNQYARSPANQFAAKLSTGGGSYDDLQNWSYWVMDDWRRGIGQRDAEAGGFLYSESETRYSDELRLPKALTMSYGLSLDVDKGFAPPNYGPETTVTIGTTQAVQQVARYLRSAGAVTSIIVKLILPNTAITGGVTVALYSDSSGSPNASLATATITPVAGIGYSEYTCTITYTTIAGTYYHIVVKPTTAGQTLTLPAFTTSVPSATFYDYNGSSWAANTASGFLHEMRGRESGQTTGDRIVWFGGNAAIMTIAQNTHLGQHKQTGLAVTTQIGSTYAAAVSDLLVAGNQLLIGQGNSSNAYVMADDYAVTSLGVPANIFALWNGYVWRAVENDIYYTADLATWSGPFETCPDGWEIRGMAGMGDYMYISTDDGLYYIGYGDAVYKVSNWAGIDAGNGAHMINYQGTLIIDTGETMFRYDGQSILPIGLDKDEGLPSDRSGTVAALVTQNNWLFAAVNATSGQDSVWAYNDQGWHYMTHVPAGHVIADMCYKREEKRIYILCDDGMVFTIYAPDVAREPSGTAGWAMYGWLETDWYFGRLLEVQKDCESVYLTGENFSSDCYAVIYWQDDSSTDWELLGTVTADRQEIRWSDYTTRPDTRQLKIGVALYTKDVTTTPIVRAIRLKYHPMVSDWYRWTFPILCSDNQQLLDDEINPYTREEMEEHLDTLIRRRHPIILEDVDGTQYEVKITGCPIQISNYRYLIDGAHYDAIYNIALEQIRSAAYGS